MKKLWIILLVVVMVLVGCQADNGGQGSQEPDDNNSGENINGSENNGQDSQDNEDKNDPNSNDSGDEGESEGELVKYKDKDIEVSIQEAFDRFMEKFPESNINEVELEYKHNSYEYKIEGYGDRTQYELKIDAYSGDILDEEREREDDEHDGIKKEDLDKLDKYLEEVFKDAGSGYWLDEYELKAKSAYVKLDIELKNDQGNELKYKYNFDTGELLEKK